ncbi:hypothetical protein Ancab_026308 [Ancistrocladus abbreviatus]
MAMEGLKRVEEVQRAVMLLQSSGIFPDKDDNANHDDDYRLLANLFLLLTKPCGELSLERKCRLVSDFMPTLTALLLEEASHLLVEIEDKQNAGSDLLPIGGAENDADDDPLPLPIHFSDMPMISFDAMQQANSTVEDFCRSYFMFHGMDANRAELIFRYLPLLSFTESYIYQMDTLNEKMYQGCGSRRNAHDKSFYSEAYSSWLFNTEALESDPFRPLALLLQRHELLTERIKDELRDGTEYWALERKLCGESSSKMEISIEDVMRAIHVKSFDYRVLNLLLYQLRGEELNEVHMEFLSASELIVEIADDLFDYEEDVLENNFNILRMFVRIYGTSKAPTMLAKVISEAEEKYDHLLKSLDPQLALSYQRRCEEATKEGGKITGHPLGSWTIPPLIADEKFYRSMFGSYER